ncbi:MAG: hypothetical protein JKY09_05110 [Crocinitomicaceae bacterium]|nr:hypothetical protein [Crocinitomicaceae bacterium]
MKIRLIILFSILATSLFSQVKKEQFPSYFGLQVRPVFPTRFIGDPELTLVKDGFETTLVQKMGYSFGATVRVGLTKLIALETGINFTERNFNLSTAVPDSNSFANDQMTFIEYDVPINGLIYIQLAKQWYMNASLGVALTFKPTDIGVLNKPGGYHTFTHTGVARRKSGFDLNANLGFEFRTEKDGFFYLGGSGRIPFAPLFDLVADYTHQGDNTRVYGEVDGSFLTLDFKYFFPNIKNKGPQFHHGPIE